MPAPIIGLSTERLVIHAPITSVGAKEAYAQAILRAGGIPVLLPVGLQVGQLGELRSRLDGILLVGGGDIDPGRFDGLPHPRIYDIDPARDELEIELVRLAVGTEWPLFGICRGIQVMNVALGGSLHTDIADQVPGSLKHDYYPNIPRDTIAHEVSIDPSSRLAAIVADTRLPTNSLHHQALSRPAPGLSITAHAPDGIIEAVELPNHPFALGVQWHPEWLVESPANQALFRAFVQAAAGA